MRKAHLQKKVDYSLEVKLDYSLEIKLGSYALLIWLWEGWHSGSLLFFIIHQDEGHILLQMFC